MLKDFGERENSRVRDLVLMLDAELLSPTRLAAVVSDVWTERDAAAPPTAFPGLPTSWPQRYERLGAENEIDPPSFHAAAERAAALWRAMFPPESL
jgi:hypothetical protein